MLLNIRKRVEKAIKYSFGRINTMTEKLFICEKNKKRDVKGKMCTGTH